MIGGKIAGMEADRKEGALAGGGVVGEGGGAGAGRQLLDAARLARLQGTIA